MQKLQADAETVALIEQVKSPYPGVRLYACEEIAYHWTGCRTNLDDSPFRPQLAEVLTGALKDPEREVRLAAATALVRTVGDAAALVPMLVGWLQKGEIKERWYAAHLLALLGVEAGGAVEALQAALEDEQPVRAIAAYALYRQGRTADGLVPTIVDALGHEDAISRRVAAHLLGYMGDSAAGAGPILAKLACTDSSTPVRRCAVASLPDVGADASIAVPALIQGLRDDDWWVRKCSADSLRIYGRRAKVAAPALVSALMDENRHVRIGAADALKEIGPSAADVAPSLLARVVDETDSLVKSRVLHALAVITPHDEALLALLVDELKEDSWFATGVLGEIGAPAVPALAEAVPRSRSAISALGDIGPAAKAAVPALLDALPKKKDHELGEIVEALAKIGPAAKAAVPALLDVLPEKKDHELRSIIWALGKIGPSARQAVPVLTSLTRSKEWQTRHDAALALARMTGSGEGIDLLVSGLSSNDADERSRAAYCLSACGPLAAPAVMPLARLLADEDDGVRESARAALGAIGPAAGGASPQLRRLLGEEDPVIRAEAAEALVRIGDARAGLQYLIGSLRDEDPVSRTWAAQCLEHLGVLAASALPELRRATNDRFLWVDTFHVLPARWEIERALRREADKKDRGGAPVQSR
ncbi:MAG: HEAT repeat domain-containing protein [Planctomycetota bacterium]